MTTISSYTEQAPSRSLSQIDFNSAITYLFEYLSGFGAETETFAAQMATLADVKNWADVSSPHPLHRTVIYTDGITYRCITDNATTNPGSSDWVALILKRSDALSVGDIVTRFRALTPTECAERRLIPLVGQQNLSRTVYADLFADQGTIGGEGDGSTTFGVLDCSGLSFRGVDDGAGVDLSAASRTAQNTGGANGDTGGSYQDDEVGPHTHPTYVQTGTGYNFADGGYGSLGTTGTNDGLETTVKNLSVYRYMRY